MPEGMDIHENLVWLYVPTDEKEEVRMIPYRTKHGLLEQVYEYLNCRIVEMHRVIDFREPWFDLDKVRMLVDEEGMYVAEPKINRRANLLWRPAYSEQAFHVHRMISTASPHLLKGDAIICTQRDTLEDGPELSPFEHRDSLMHRLMGHLNRVPLHYGL